MSYSRLFLRSLLIPLFATSFYVLWVRDSGFFRHVGETVRSGHHIDGAAVRTTYTGIESVDEILTVFVTFYYPLVSQAGRDKLGDWLVADMLGKTVLFTTACLAEGYRERQENGFRRWWIALPGLWMLSYQVLGMAVVMPLFCFFHLGNSKEITQKTLQPVAKGVASGLIPAALMGGFAPMLLTILPLGLDSNVMQKTIAMCQLYPLYVALVIASFYYQPGVIKTKTNVGKYTTAYLVMSFTAAVIHIVTLFRLSQTGEFWKGLMDFYWLDFVNEVESPVGATALFLKFDGMMASIAGLIWAGILAADAGVKDVWMILAVGTVCGGPGAGIGAALIMREGRVGRKRIAGLGQKTYGTMAHDVPVPGVEGENDNRVDG